MRTYLVCDWRASGLAGEVLCCGGGCQVLPRGGANLVLELGNDRTAVVGRPQRKGKLYTPADQDVSGKLTFKHYEVYVKHFFT